MTTTERDDTDATNQKVKTYQYFTNGEWRHANDASTFEVYEPFSRAVFANVANCGRAETKDAIKAATSAFLKWAELTSDVKSALFLKAASIVDRRRDEFSQILARETGCTIFFAQFQQDLVKKYLEQAAGWVYLPKGEIIQSDVPGTYSSVVRRPIGVVACLTPWNGASVLVWRSVVLPLSAGNTVVVKPSEEAPISAGLLVAEVTAEAGFPPGVINVVTHAAGQAATIADEFFRSPDVRCINFTGSVKTGRILAERAGRELKRSVMELGGYNALIVLADVDLDYAVRVAAFSAFFHQGQICMSARKILVQRDVYDEFLTRFIDKTNALPMGDPEDAATIVGPLINPQALATVTERVREAVDKGARIVAGGGWTGQVHEPTILIDVPADATIAFEETFGPVVIVQPVDDALEAVDVVNSSMYGLSTAILCADTFHGIELAAYVKSGAVHINIPTVDDEVQAPIGGVRDSGWGRTGTYGLQDFSDYVWINAQSGERHLPIK